jgi:hypothetical protein
MVTFPRPSTTTSQGEVDYLNFNLVKPWLRPSFLSMLASVGGHSETFREQNGILSFKLKYNPGSTRAEHLLELRRAMAKSSSTT